MSYKISINENGFYVKYSGLVTVTELIQGQKALDDALLGEKIEFVLVDFCGSTLSLDQSDLESLATNESIPLEMTSEKLTVALVGDDNHLPFLKGYSVLASTLKDYFDYKVYGSLKDAANAFQITKIN